MDDLEISAGSLSLFATWLYRKGVPALSVERVIGSLSHPAKLRMGDRKWEAVRGSTLVKDTLNGAVFAALPVAKEQAPPALVAEISPLVEEALSSINHEFVMFATMCALLFYGVGRSGELLYASARRHKFPAVTLGQLRLSATEVRAQLTYSKTGQRGTKDAYMFSVGDSSESVFRLLHKWVAMRKALGDLPGDPLFAHLSGKAPERGWFEGHLKQYLPGLKRHSFRAGATKYYFDVRGETEAQVTRRGRWKAARVMRQYYQR